MAAALAHSAKAIIRGWALHSRVQPLLGAPFSTPTHVPMYLCPSEAAVWMLYEFALLQQSIPANALHEADHSLDCKAFALFPTFQSGQVPVASPVIRA